MTQHGQSSNIMAGPGIMLISALIFAYFGFGTKWNYTSSNTGEFLLFVALLDWTLKATAVAFGISAVVAFVNQTAGNLMYAAFGLISAVLFVVVAILDTTDKQHTAMSPFLLLIFAAWNGYNSWTGLKELMARRPTANGNSPFAPTG